MVLLLWRPGDNVAADSAGESLVASGGFIFARMAIATQIMALRPIVPYNLLVVQFGGIVVIMFTIE